MIWFLRFIRVGWWGYKAPVRVYLDVLTTLAIGVPVSHLAVEKNVTGRTVAGRASVFTVREVI